MKLSKYQTSFWQNEFKMNLIVLFGILMLLILPNKVLAVKVDPLFNPEILREATITSIAVQSNGKVIVAGDIIKVAGQEHSYVVRFNADGSNDETFNTDLLSRAVSDIAIQADGKIILVGRFLPFNGQGTNRIVRLNEDGSLDQTFDSGTGANENINSVQILNLTNGKIYIGGGFTEYNGVVRNRIARLNANGSLDTTFNPNTGANGMVRDLRVQSDGKVVIVGEFTTYNGTARNRIARLNSDGTLDTSFNPGTGFNFTVICLELQTNGNILAGGSFTTFNGSSRNRIAQLSSNGAVTTSFAGSGANGFVWEIALGANGNQIYLGGGFTTYNQLSRNGIVSVDATGAADINFNQGGGINMTSPNLFPKVLAIKEVNSGNGILFGGIFQIYNGASRVSLARTSTTGILSPTFDSPIYTNGSINTVFTQSNGKILVSGNFYLVNGTTRNRIARLNSDGGLDNSFDPGTSTDSFSFTARAIQPDGRIYIDGSFTSFNGVTRNRVARLNVDGSVDLTFNPNAGPNSLLNDIKVQSDGKLIVVGYFTSYSGVARSYIARLNADGSLDTSLPLFNPSTNSGIVEAKFDNNGGILLAGFFTICNGTARSRIARINASTGALDTSFNPGSGTNDVIYSIGTDRNEIVNNNNFTIGGEFTQYSGVNIGRIAKLQSNGTLDLNFNANAGSGLNAAPYIMRIQSDGKIVTVGSFSSYAGIERGRIVRINQNGTIDSSFNPKSGASDFINYLDLSSNEDESIVVGDFSRFSCSRRTGIAKIIPGSDSTCQESNLNNEADVFSRPNGDGFVDSDDIQQIRRFALGLDAASLGGEYQRADCSFRNTLGDGYIDSDDVVQARRYALGLDASQLAGGPSSPPPIAPPVLDNVPADDSDKMLRPNDNAAVRKTGKIPAVSAALRVDSQNISAGQTLVVPIRIDTVGDEAGYTFSLNYDASRLTDPQVAIGNAGGDVIFNANNPGQIGFSVTSFNGGTIAAGTDQVLVNVTFTTVANAEARATPIIFTDTIARRKASGIDPNNPITQPTYTGGTITIGGAAAPTDTTISGRVVTANGRGIGNVIVTLTDANGSTRTAATTTFGYYRFTDVPAGQTYIISAAAKRYKFGQPTQLLNLNVENPEIDFVAIE